MNAALFFSGRRRHTRSVSAFLLSRSSDLFFVPNKRKSKHSAMLRNKETRHRMFRSEERRVGKECRFEGEQIHYEANHFARREVLTGSLVREFRETADELLVEVAHLQVRER